MVVYLHTTVMRRSIVQLLLSWTGHPLIPRDVSLSLNLALVHAINPTLFDLTASIILATVHTNNFQAVAILNSGLNKVD